MPPASSPGLHDSHRLFPRFSAGDRAARVRFRRAMTLMLMTLFLPGSAQLVAGHRKVGLVALRIFFGIGATLLLTVVAAWLWNPLAFWLVSNTLVLGLLRFALMLAAIGWAGLFMDAWRIGQPLTLAQHHRRAVVGVNGFLCLSVAGSLLFGAHLVGVQKDFLSMFGSGPVSGSHDGRFNVLLVGGDSGAGRWGLRPDSMTIASIDAVTGRTVLIGLPRNMANFPFRKGTVMHQQFPDGFNCDGCYLNGVSTWAGDNTELFGNSKTPGMDATIMAIEGITGLRINYWAMVNLAGFKGLVDAVGGVTLNVRSPIPVGGLGKDVTGYIKPGVRKLNGHDTLWYARAREGSDDYSRMARQKCVMNAMLQQISPQVALRNFDQIAKASSAMISTNVPGGEVDRFLQLALKAKGEKVSTLSLVPPMINTGNPDIAKVRSKVAEAIDRAEGQGPAPSKVKKRADQPVTGGSLGSLSGGYAANESSDLGSAC